MDMNSFCMMMYRLHSMQEVLSSPCSESQATSKPSADGNKIRLGFQ